MALIKNGLRAGYTEFRYGGAKPVSLAGDGSQRARPLIKGAARQSLLNRLIDTMEDWRSTPFENEGAARAGLREGFILKGNGWTRSDAQAAEIVEDALRELGARRPSWEEAQAGHALSGDFCSWCYTAINEKDRSRGRRFCSAGCAKVALEYMARKTSHHYGAILRSAKRLLDQEKAEPQTCIYCERKFQADRTQRFCSQSCRGLYLAGDRILRPIECGQCQTTFKPWNHQQRYCSSTCGQFAARRKEAESLAGVRLECAECRQEFQPTTKHSRFCSTLCSDRASNRAYRERNRPPTPPRANCSWCGEEYQPKIALRNGKVGTCSPRCNSDRSRFGKGVQPRDLTRRVFDHYIALPVDEFRRRILTPEKFDWLAMEMGRSLTGEVAMPAPRITDALFAAS